MTLPYEDLSHNQLLRFTWHCHRVTTSGLAPHDKLLLLLLLYFDPLGHGVSLPWRELTARSKLSLSSCRRAAERLELLKLLSVERHFEDDLEPSSNRFFHLLTLEQNMWHVVPKHFLFQAESLDLFLEMRAGFEQALQTRIEELSTSKGASWKKQGRSSSHSLRAWRQTFGPIDQEGNALEELARYSFDKKPAQQSKEHVHEIASYCLKRMFPQGPVEQLLRATPSQCISWLKTPR